jgi:MerR family transcriptional regulator, light-induced transcriptional regulator
MIAVDRYRLDSDALASFDAGRRDAVQYAAHSCEAAFPDLYAPFGERGREHCIEDIGFHLDFLRTTLETGDRYPFIAYLGWLADVLRSRNVPLDSLPHSLDALADYFRRYMGYASEPIVAALGDALDAFRRGIPPPRYGVPGPSAWEESAPFRDSALRGERQGAALSFNAALERSRSLTQAAVHVIQPALYEIGQLWQENQVSVAQEHLAAAITQTLMAQGFGKYEPAPDNGRTALFACVTGNHHTLGLRMVADAFELAGWRVHYLGANTPLPSLIHHARELLPDLIGLSASLPFQLMHLREAVQRLRAEFPGDKRPHIVVGGLVLNQFPPLAASIGAELMGTDAIAAVESATARLAGNR